MKTIKAIYLLSRPLNCLITFFTIVIATYICSASINLTLSLLAGFIGALVNAGGNIINDYFDIEIDKINRPNRPLASGLIKKQFALRAYIYLTFFALSLSYFNLPTTALYIVIVTILMMFIYSFKFKRLPLVGNFVVSFFTGLAFLFGSVVVGNIYCGIIPACFAFIISFMRELVKDIEDIEGDKSIGASTFPVKYGVNKSVKLISILGVILILATTVPVLLKIYNWYYFIFVSFFVNSLLIIVIDKLNSKTSLKILRDVSNLLKVGMVFGVISILIGVKF
mgnify:CR=1 FL=1